MTGPVALRPGTVGTVGAGSTGSALARALTTAGHDVVIAGSRGPEALTDLVAELGPRARAATAAEAAAAGEVVLDTGNDDPAATALVVDLLDEIGVDAVDLGPLAQSWRIERDTPGYGPQLDADGLRAALDAAPRTPGSPA